MIGLGGTSKDMHITDAEMSRMTANGGFTLGSSTAAGLVVDGISASSTDTHARIVLDSTQSSGTVEFASFTSTFDKGITIQALGGIVLSQGFQTSSSESILNAGPGTLTVIDTRTLSTTDQRLTITADDMDLQGTSRVCSGTAAMIITTSTSKTIGLGTLAGDSDIEIDELQGISCNGLTIGSLGINTGVLVNGVSDASSSGIMEIVTLLATVDSSVITFGASASTFYGLSVQADNGIVIGSGITTTTSIMYLDGDFDGSVATADTNIVSTAASIMLQSKTLLTLETATGNTEVAGALTLEAGSGILIYADITSLSTAGTGPIVINSDNNGNSDGTLTVHSNKVISSNHNHVTVTAWDFDLQGRLTAGESAVVVHGAYTSQTIGLGVNADLVITDSELGRITCAAGITLGSVHTDDVYAGGIGCSSLAACSTKAIGTVTLIATKASKTVEFRGSASGFDKGLIVQAAGGAVLSQSVTTYKNVSSTSGQAGVVLLSTGIGALTLDTSVVLSTSNELLVITGDDFVLETGSSLSAGNAAIRVSVTTSGQTIGLGATTQSMTIESAEFSGFECTGLLLGDSTSGTITVDGISSANSNGVDSILTLSGVRDDAQVNFEAGKSVFNTLVVQADNGIRFEADLETDTSYAYLDADVENSSSADIVNALGLTDGCTVSAKSLLTLEVTTGSIVAAGAFTLAAGNGIIILDSTYSSGSGSSVVINSDYESPGDGILTIVTGKTIVTTQTLIITAWDIDLQGSLQISGTGDCFVYGAQTAQTVGLGLTASDMHISDVELQRITSPGLKIGGVNAGTITSDKVTKAASLAVDFVRLRAAADTASVQFLNAGSTFNSLEAQADNGVVVTKDLTTETALMYLDGDYENNLGSDSINIVGFTDGRTMASSTMLTLESTTGSIVSQGLLSLFAGAGIMILDDTTSASAGTPVVINADYDSAGDGTLTVQTGMTVTTNNSDLTITAWDIDLDGSLTAGTKTIFIHGAKDVQTVGLGATANANMHIEDTELQRMTANSGLILGGDTVTGGSITVDGITAAGDTVPV